MLVHVYMGTKEPEGKNKIYRSIREWPIEEERSERKIERGRLRPGRDGASVEEIDREKEGESR